MKTSKLLLAASLIVLAYCGANAQTDYGTVGVGVTATQVIRNATNPTYTVANPDGAAATFTWTVTGGTIVVGGVDQVSPYTAAAANAIEIRWSNTNRNTANTGTVTVTKVVDYGGGAVTCTPSTAQTFNVEAWTSPKGDATTADFDDCAGATPSVALAFEGRANYEYQWRVYNQAAPGVDIQTSGGWVSGAAATATVNIAALANATAADIVYVFELTQMRDGFIDIAAGTITDSQVLITIHPIPVVGPVNSSSSLILR